MIDKKEKTWLLKTSSTILIIFSVLVVWDWFRTSGLKAYLDATLSNVWATALLVAVAGFLIWIINFQLLSPDRRRRRRRSNNRKKKGGR